MKQGTNFILPIKIDYSLDLVARIEFIFKQPQNNNVHIKDYVDIKDVIDTDIEKVFEYPSDTAEAVEGENVINLYWSMDDTYKFNYDEMIYMDTRIHLNNSNENPETPIIKLRMSPTLFKQSG